MGSELFIPWIAFMGLYNGSVSTLPEELSIRVGSSGCDSGRIYRVRVARSEAEKRKGLGGVEQPLASDQGMIFVFSPPGPQSFWMKDTWIPLAILFFDANGKLLSQSEMSVEPDPANPTRSYRESRPSSAVLEIASGSTAYYVPERSYLCVRPTFGTSGLRESE